MRREIERALAALTDGHSTDWHDLESRITSPASRDTFRALRLVACIRQTLHLPARSPATPPCGAVHGTWGPFDLVEHLATGLHGDVFRARDRRLERDVALKLLRSDSPGDGAVSQTAVEEGRLLARVRHPNVVAVYGADRVDGQAGVWMEFVRGRTLLDEVTECGPLDASAAARTVLEVCRGLAAVHAAGFVHGDVKAQNVVREETGRIVLIDLGCGRPIGDSSQARYGTLPYLAPEIGDGAAASARSDVYSAGVLLFFLITGRYPARNRQRRAPSAAVLHTLVSTPRQLASIIERALNPQPCARYADAGELECALAAFLGRFPMPEATPPPGVSPGSSFIWRVVGGTVAGAVVVGAAAAWLRRWRDRDAAERVRPEGDVQRRCPAPGQGQ